MKYSMTQWVYSYFVTILVYACPDTLRLRKITFKVQIQRYNKCIWNTVDQCWWLPSSTQQILSCWVERWIWKCKSGKSMTGNDKQWVKNSKRIMGYDLCRDSEFWNTNLKFSKLWLLTWFPVSIWCFAVWYLLLASVLGSCGDELWLERHRFVRWERIGR